MEKRKQDAQERLDEGTTNNPWLRFRDQQYASGNFDMKRISDLWAKRKKRMAREARDAQDRADDLAFAQQEFEDDQAQRREATAPLREAMRRSGRIAKKRESQAGEGTTDQDGEGWLDDHPFFHQLTDDAVGAAVVGGLALATGGMSLEEAPGEWDVAETGVSALESKIARSAATESASALGVRPFAGSAATRSLTTATSEAQQAVDSSEARETINNAAQCINTPYK